jgi:hypothetical protein
MGKQGRTNSVSKEAAVQRLVEELRTQTSPKAILSCLDMLNNGLTDKRTGEKVFLTFMRAGGPPILIRHMGKPTTSTLADAMRARIPIEAARAFGALLLTSSNDLMAELQVATGVVTPLVDVLRDAPMPSRLAAASGLSAIAEVQPAHRKAMAEAGVLGLLLTLTIDVGYKQPAEDLALVLARLACMLIESGPVAARDIKGAIRAPDTVRCFAALVLLQVCGWRVCCLMLLCNSEGIACSPSLHRPLFASVTCGQYRAHDGPQVVPACTGLHIVDGLSATL